MSEEKFIVDSSALITAYDQYYALDLVPSFWDKLPTTFSSGRIFVLDLVVAEINGGLKDWLKQQKELKICRHTDRAIAKQYKEIIDYLSSSDFYSQAAADGWAADGVADAWLIAMAKVYDYVIITSEVPAKKLDSNSPLSNAKIPDVADYFGVKHKDLFYMMRGLGFTV